jgi:hypothetical protein
MNILYALVLISGLLINTGCPTTPEPKSGIKIINGITIEKGATPEFLKDLTPSLKWILSSPDGEKLAFFDYALHITNINNLKEIISFPFSVTAEFLFGWSPDSEYVVCTNYIDFISVNITTKEMSVFSVQCKSFSRSERLWYVIKQDNNGKILVVHPTDVEKDDPLLKNGMLPYQVVKKEGASNTEEKEIWIRTKERDFKILDNVGGIYQAILSQARNRLLINFAEPYRPDKHKGEYLLKGRCCVYDLKTNKLYDLPVDAKDFSWSPDGEWLLYPKETGKSVGVDPKNSIYEKMYNKQMAYFEWEGLSYHLNNLFAISWNGEKVVQLTKNDDNRKTIILNGPATWISNNKIAFFYTDFKYDKMEATQNSIELKEVIPSWGIKIGEIIFEIGKN